MIEKQKFPVLKSYLIYELPQNISFSIDLYPISCQNMFFNISRVVTLYPIQKIEDFLEKNEHVAFVTTFYSNALPETVQDMIVYIDHDSAFRKYRLAGELVSACIWSGISAIRNYYMQYAEDQNFDIIPFTEQANGHKSLLSLIDELYETFDEKDIKTFTEGFILYGASVSMNIPASYILVIN